MPDCETHHVIDHACDVVWSLPLRDKQPASSFALSGVHKRLAL